MPLISVPCDDDAGPAVELFYEVHGTTWAPDGDEEDHRPKALMLMGFGATGQVWAPQLADLLAAKDETGESPMLVCIMDNRGVGRSSCPCGLRHYSTEIMAKDALAVVDCLGWQRFHLIGHSMGSMIACKLSALVPQRVLSLSIISGTGGGWQAVPQTAKALWLGIKKMFVKSLRGRAEVDVQFHFSSSLLAEVDPITKQCRRDIVVREYMEAYREEESQEEHSGGGGFKGQLAAVMRHRLRRRDIKSIQLGQFPIQVIHGRQDVIALPKYGARLAERLAAPCILLEGGHFVGREQAAAVNALLRSLVLGASFANVERYPYIPFRHWVSVVEEHREHAAQLALRRLQSGGSSTAGRMERKQSWPAWWLGWWDRSVRRQQAQQQQQQGSQHVVSSKGEQGMQPGLLGQPGQGQLGQLREAGSGGAGDLLQGLEEGSRGYETGPGLGSNIELEPWLAEEQQQQQRWQQQQQPPSAALGATASQAAQSSDALEILPSWPGAQDAELSGGGSSAAAAGQVNITVAPTATAAALSARRRSRSNGSSLGGKDDGGSGTSLQPLLPVL